MFWRQVAYCGLVVAGVLPSPHTLLFYALLLWVTARVSLTDGVTSNPNIFREMCLIPEIVMQLFPCPLSGDKKVD